MKAPTDPSIGVADNLLPFGEPKATHDLKRVPVSMDIRAFNTNRCSKIDMLGLRDIIQIVGTRWFNDGHKKSPGR
ncbi:hypothetical protein CWI81_09215 [Idiomarina seosinensis]|uniref:Uncharacterized protein n=1 Tax=Idiomarina seosinensis TaxID=281739 RepID=A0A432ZB23_9GAMM|nr:hypothetical protein CWI81_09215 [Idiomarina seosinensis]